MYVWLIHFTTDLTHLLRDSTGMGIPSLQGRKKTQGLETYSFYGIDITGTKPLLAAMRRQELTS